MNIYAGNLSFDVTEEDLQKAFESYGTVATVNLIKDRFSGESKGFGFIEMASKEEAKAAIDGLNGTEIKGKNIRVNEALPREDNRNRRGGGGGGGNRGRNNRGGGGGGGGYGKRY
jgi:RNA recognition motif-containing protein